MEVQWQGKAWSAFPVLLHCCPQSRSDLYPSRGVQLVVGAIHCFVCTMTSEEQTSGDNVQHFNPGLTRTP